MFAFQTKSRLRKISAELKTQFIFVWFATKPAFRRRCQCYRGGSGSLRSHHIPQISFCSLRKTFEGETGGDKAKVVVCCQRILETGWVASELCWLFSQSLCSILSLGAEIVPGKIK